LKALLAEPHRAKAAPAETQTEEKK
jgi:hypothetical protein